MKNVGLLMLLIFLRITACAQDDPMNYLIDSLVREHHIKQMRIDVRTVNAWSDTTMLLETRYFDARGNKIKSLSPKSRDSFNKSIHLYDSLNRKILYRSYDEKDTTIFHSEKKWIYTDSAHYREEQYYEGKLTEFNTYLIETSGDTLWVTEDEHSLEYDRRNHKVSRYRMVGDTLQISEHIKYDDSLRLEGVDTYFWVKRDLDTGYLIMAGQYRVQMDIWDQFHRSDSLMRDFYMHPDKYIQMQLDGEFAYEYDDDPFTYQIYNYNNQLLQNDRGIFKSTYTYNAEGQLTKVTQWGQDEGGYDYGIKERGYVYYEYNDKGLPIKVTTENLTNGYASTHILYYTYSY
jgi:hypothetical protein